MGRSDPVVIVGASRTPMGAFRGELSGARASVLGASAIAGALTGARVAPDAVDEVIMGCVLTAGQGQAPARQAALAAEIPDSTGCTTLNKMCGSGMKATMLAHDLLVAGSGNVIVGGGMESMSNAPYLLEHARAGYRLGHARLADHMLLDGLEDCFGDGGLMGTFAEACARHYQFTRAAQDEFALRSLTRAKASIENGTFAQEITAVEIDARSAKVRIEHDEQPRRAEPEKIPRLKPAFQDNGTVTAANSSSISDGAAALVLMRASTAERGGWNVRARIVGHATHAQAPAWFTTAPIGAIRGVLERTGWARSQVDLFEINEAFAVVAMAAMRDLDLTPERVNVHGGACALGHPVGASGARIIVTLLNALERHDLKRGVAALCIAGGEATAVAIERE